MALDGIITSLPGAVAGEDFTRDDLYTVVAIQTTAGQGNYSIVKPDDAAAGPNIGVLYSYGVAGQSVQVVIGGIAKFKAGGALTPGDVVAGLDGVAGNKSAIVLTEASGAGEIVEILI